MIELLRDTYRCAQNLRREMAPDQAPAREGRGNRTARFQNRPEPGMGR